MVMNEIAAPKTKIAIYDMDKTITAHATYNGFLRHVMMHHARWRIILLPIMPIGLLLYACKIWDRARLKEFAQSLFIGSTADWRALCPLTETYADHIWQTDIYPQFAARIAQEKSEAYIHVIATASYLIYASPIAMRLHIDHVIATELEMDDAGNNLLAKIAGENCYGMAKLDRVKAWMASQGHDRATCHIRAYSDHVSDAPLLSYADEAFATNPHPPLATLAKAQRWAILDWR